MTESLPVNVLDAVILVVLLLSAIIGLLRGFVREVLSILAWVGAGWLTLTLFPDARAFVNEYLDNPTLITVIAGGGTFLLLLVVFTIVARLISERTRRSTLVGPLDRMLGFGFGVVRGAVLVCLTYILVLLLADGAEAPGWAKESRLLPYVDQGAKMIRDVVPSDLDIPELKEGDTLTEKGYKRAITEGMDDLFESVTDQ